METIYSGFHPYLEYHASIINWLADWVYKEDLAISYFFSYNEQKKVIKMS